MELEDGTLVLGSNSTFADSTIDGGAGLGLDDASGAGEQASPVDLGMIQRMDDLLEAMSDTQVGTVQAHIVNLGATDMVGALSAMGVFNMGDRTDNQTDPTLTNFMPVFDALDEDAQALVLKNANPLDLDSMTAVTNTVDAIEAFNDTVSGVAGARHSSIADAVSAVRATMELEDGTLVLGSNSTFADSTIDGGAQRMDDLFDDATGAGEREGVDMGLVDLGI